MEYLFKSHKFYKNQLEPLIEDKEVIFSWTLRYKLTEKKEFQTRHAS